MFTPEKIEEWIREVQERPTSAPLIIQFLADRLRDLDDWNQKLRAENLELRSGASAVINASWSSRIGFNTRGVLGETGTAFVSGTAIGNNGIWCSRQLHIKTDRDEYERVEILQDDLDNASYQQETNDFISAISNGTTPRASVRDGLETVKISHAILESSRTRRIVRLWLIDRALTYEIRRRGSTQ